MCKSRLVQTNSLVRTLKWQTDWVGYRVWPYARTEPKWELLYNFFFLSKPRVISSSFNLHYHFAMHVCKKANLCFASSLTRFLRLISLSSPPSPSASASTHGLKSQSQIVFRRELCLGCLVRCRGIGHEVEGERWSFWVQFKCRSLIRSGTLFWFT